MKRDLDLIREILVAVENSENPNVAFDSIEELAISLERNDLSNVSFQVSLLEDACLIKTGKAILGQGYPDVPIYRLTNNGYSYLENIRDKTIWEKIFPKLTTASDSLAVSTVSNLITQLLIK